LKFNDTEQELYEMHRLNVELMDTLILIGFRFMDYCEKHNIAVDGLESLETLIARAEKLVNEIGTPYRGNPIRHLSDENLRDDDNRRRLDRTLTTLQIILEAKKS